MNPIHKEQAHKSHWPEIQASKEYGIHSKEVPEGNGKYKRGSVIRKIDNLLNQK